MFIDDLWSNFYKRKNIVVPGVEAGGEAQFHCVLQDFPGWHWVGLVISAHWLPEEGDADNLGGFRAWIENAINTIPFLKLSFFGRGGEFVKFVDLFFGEDGEDIGPGHMEW